MRILIGTILALIFSTPVYSQTTGMDRCVAVRHCLCNVQPGPRPDRTRTQENARRFSIYFEEDSSILPDGQAAELREFFARFENNQNRTVSIIGYTDGCGSAEYNERLANQRASVVSPIISQAMRGVRISRSAGGETSVGHLAEARRVDVVVHTTSRLTTAIDKVPADFYLIDASGSMWNGWRDWNDVVNASVRPGSKVYLSIMTGCRQGQTLASVTPQSGTEIWWSYWNVLDRMKPGQTLAIISDFDSNVPLSRGERVLIDKKVRERGINVIAIRP
jgi:hypothetical protein